MTDSEIIKALECCLCPDERGRHDCCKCSIECGVFKTDNDCILTLQNATIKLINRQKAEIDKYKKVKVKQSALIDDLRQQEYAQVIAIDGYKAKIEELKIELQAMRNAANGFKKENEKQFSKVCDTKKFIDNLVKEMTEEGIYK